MSELYPVRRFSQQRLSRRNAIEAAASRFFHHGTKQVWDTLVLIALGEFTEPARRPKVRYMSDGQILPTEEGKRRKIWDFFATRFDDASPEEPFDAKAAKRILHKWSNLVSGCRKVTQRRTRHLFRPTQEEWREVADQIRVAKKNGPTLGKPHYPFAEKEKQYSKYTTEALYHAMNDAMEASRAQQGWNETGANWYLDDYHTIVKEIQRRKRRSR